MNIKPNILYENVKELKFLSLKILIYHSHIIIR
jgi:hypothetical protein